MKIRSKSEQGRISRNAGKRFELEVRHDLESKGWIISKWNNQVDLENKKLIPAKHKYNPFTKSTTIGNGMPDFICIRWKDD